MLKSGAMVRLIRDPQQMGALQDIVEHSGRKFGKVLFPGGVRRVPLAQLELVPAATEEPLDFLRGDA